MYHKLLYLLLFLFFSGPNEEELLKFTQKNVKIC